mmetsp:Transcript_26187/g.67558  ORF Transcript_26187/g.67558 Transcript_26187/m.67558 type:complete len:349 (+) Transcript_26187:469-1515(+)
MSASSAALLVASLKVASSCPHGAAAVVLVLTSLRLCESVTFSIVSSNSSWCYCPAEDSLWCTIGMMVMWVAAPIAMLPWVASSIVPEVSVLEAMPGPAAVDEPGIHWRASHGVQSPPTQARPVSHATAPQAQRSDLPIRDLCSRTRDCSMWLITSVVIFARICCTQHESFSVTASISRRLVVESMVGWMCGAISVAVVELLTDSLTVVLVVAALSALGMCIVSEELAETRATDTMWSASLSGLMLGLLEGAGCISLFSIVGPVYFLQTYLPTAVAGQLFGELLLSVEDYAWSTPKAARFHVQAGFAAFACLSACALRHAIQGPVVSRTGPPRSPVMRCSGDRVVPEEA